MLNLLFFAAIVWTAFALTNLVNAFAPNLELTNITYILMNGVGAAVLLGFVFLVREARVAHRKVATIRSNRGGQSKLRRQAGQSKLPSGKLDASKVSA